MATLQGDHARQQQQEDEDHLHRRFQHLQHDWNSYMQSTARRRRSCSATDVSTFTSADLLELIHDSPKKLVSALQPPRESTKPNVAERGAAVRSGKLRGRRLLESLERVKDEAGLHGGQEMCSVCSSVLVQGAEVDSSSSYCSSCIGECSYLQNEECMSSSSLSSSPPPSSLENTKKKRVGRVRKQVAGGDHGGKWMARVAVFAVIAVVLAVALICLSEFGMEERVDFMIPT
ncbi:hypothetical protein OPV22_019384 [Ensete ventricosum]|uniref:Uncharacterized protein n=1 Tax=Ensete ventricosum TaxID=4639 RepID=A0AAV8QKT9_ENSVE|nr:hypothetical protein OPV22_019384 [Ensete ventricosum]